MSLSQVDIKELGEGIVKSNKELQKKYEEVGAVVKTTHDAVVAMQKRQDKFEKTFTSDPIKNSEIEKREKALKENEDKVKTECLKIEAQKKFGTVDGLANTLALSFDRSILKGNPEASHQLAKSILHDPFRDEAKKAFLSIVKTGGNMQLHTTQKAIAKYGEFQEKVKQSDVSEDESYIKKAITRIDSEQAGYLAPPEFDLTLNKTMFETSPIRQVATVMTTTRQAYEFVMRTSLPTTYWGSSEQGTKETEEQKYKTGRISIHELSAIPSISLNMLEDSAVNIENELRNDLAEAFSLEENKSFIQGDGNVQPRGLLDYAQDGANAYDITKPLQVEYVEMKLADYNQDGKTYVLADALLNLEGRVLSAYKNGAVYLISRGIKNLIRQVKDRNNQFLFSTFTGWGGFQGVPGIRDGMSGRLSGYPILECDDLPSTFVTGEYPIWFGNFSKYKIIDRVGLMLIMDNITTKGFVKYYFRKRLGAGFVLTQGVKALRIT